MTSSNSWTIPYGNAGVTDLQKAPSEILEDFLKTNWSLQHPTVYWKYWDGHHDYTIKVEEGSTTSEPLTNEWLFFSYKSNVLIHLFGRTITAGNSIPDNLVRVRQHLENLIKQTQPSSSLQDNDGIYNVRYVRTYEGPPPESVSAGSSHHIFHIIMQVQMAYAKRVQ